MVTRYILMTADGAPAMWCHQDDMEDPVVADGIPELLETAAEWADIGSTLDFIDEMGENSEGQRGQYFGYRIMRQEIQDFPLSAEELALIERIRVREQKEVDEQKARFAAGDFSFSVKRDDEEDED